MSSVPDNDLAPLFKPFEWVGKSDQADSGRYTMLSNIRDLVSGTSLALQLIERSDLQRERGDAPIIDGADALRFTRMSIAAMSVIEGYIDEHFDDMSDSGATRRQVAAQKEGPA